MKRMEHDGPDGIVVRVILQGRGRPTERSFLGPDFICRLRTKLSEVEHIDVTVLIADTHEVSRKIDVKLHLLVHFDP